MRAAARAFVPEDDRQAWRTLHVARQEALIKALWPNAIKGDTKAAATVRSILDSQARLLGLDAPSVSITAYADIESEIASRLKILRDLERQEERKALQRTDSDVLDVTVEPDDAAAG